MPTNYPNPYRDNRQMLGGFNAGLSNLANAMLAQPGIESRRELMEAQQMAAQAQAGFHTAKQREIDQQAAGAQGYLANVAKSLLGETGDQGIQFLQGGTRNIPAYEDESRQMTVAPQSGVPVARPANMSPEAEQLLRRAMLVAPGIRAGGGNAEQIADALLKTGKQEAFDGVLSGKVDPTRYLIANEKPAFHFSESGAGNNATGAFELNGLGKAKVLTEGTKQVENRANANHHNASAGAASRSNQLMTVDIDGVKVKVPTGTVYAEQGKNSRNAENNKPRVDVAGERPATGNKPGKQLKASKSDLAALESALSDNLGADEDFPIDPADPMYIKAKEIAQSIFSTPGTAGYANHGTAARLATEGMTTQQEGNWNPLKANRSRISGGEAANPAQQPSQQPKQPVSNAPKAGVVKDGYRFKGGNPADKKNWELVGGA